MVDAKKMSKDGRLDAGSDYAGFCHLLAQTPLRSYLRVARWMQWLHPVSPPGATAEGVTSYWLPQKLLDSV